MITTGCYIAVVPRKLLCSRIARKISQDSESTVCRRRLRRIRDGCRNLLSGRSLRRHNHQLLVSWRRQRPPTYRGNRHNIDRLRRHFMTISVLWHQARSGTADSWAARIDNITWRALNGDANLAPSCLHLEKHHRHLKIGGNGSKSRAHRDQKPPPGIC